MRAAWWWIDRWRKSTAYTDMTAEAQGVYRNLLDELWLRDGAIPAKEKVLAQISGDYEAWPRVRDEVLSRFVLTDGSYRHSTHDAIMAESLKRAEKQKRYRERRDNVTGNVTSSPSPSPSPSKEQTPEPRKRRKPPTSVSSRAASLTETLARVPQWEKLDLIHVGNYLDAHDLLPPEAVDAEVAKSVQWALANPRKAVKKNLCKFFASWLGRAADNGAAKRVPGNGPILSKRNANAMEAIERFVGRGSDEG